MNELILNYIRNMKKTGYTVQQIRVQLLKKYPPSFVDTYLHQALANPSMPKKRMPKPPRPKLPTPEKDGPHTYFEHHDEKIPLLEKIIGLLIRPMSIFKRLKSEDMIHSFYFYFSIYFLLSLVFAGVMYFFLSSFNGLVAIPSGILLYYFFILLIQALLLPFGLAGFYYLFLKVIFKMDSSYDESYKALVYTMSQFVLLLIPVLLISSLGYFNPSLSFIFLGLMVLLWFYNTFTLIMALSDLCSVKVWKASLVVLLPIFLGLGIIFYFYSSYGAYLSSIPI